MVSTVLYLLITIFICCSPHSPEAPGTHYTHKGRIKFTRRISASRSSHRGVGVPPALDPSGFPPGDALEHLRAQARPSDTCQRQLKIPSLLCGPGISSESHTVRRPHPAPCTGLAHLTRATTCPP